MFLQVQDKSKVFVTQAYNTEDENITQKFKQFVERFERIITLNFVLPNTDKGKLREEKLIYLEIQFFFLFRIRIETLEKMSIPSYEESESPLISTPSPSSLGRSFTKDVDTPSSGDVVDAVMTAAPAPPCLLNSIAVEYIFQIPNSSSTSSGGNVHNYMAVNEHESHSEDSSLSDGDRTLVDSGPDMGDFPSTNNSPACSDTQLSTPEYQTKRISDFDCDDDIESNDLTKLKDNYYFRAVHYEETHGDYDESAAEKKQQMLKVLADTKMTINQLKRSLEPFVRVPKEYFKIFRMSSSQTETECTRLDENLTLFRDNERLTIELGRALRKGEFKCKVYY